MSDSLKFEQLEERRLLAVSVTAVIPEPRAASQENSEKICILY
jgi:hypothetical protein